MIFMYIGDFLSVSRCRIRAIVENLYNLRGRMNRLTGGNYCGARRLERYMNRLEHYMKFASGSAQH